MPATTAEKSKTTTTKPKSTTTSSSSTSSSSSHLIKPVTRSIPIGTKKSSATDPQGPSSATRSKEDKTQQSILPISPHIFEYKKVKTSTSSEPESSSPIQIQSLPIDSGLFSRESTTEPEVAAVFNPNFSSAPTEDGSEEEIDIRGKTPELFVSLPSSPENQQPSTSESQQPPVNPPFTASSFEENLSSLLDQFNESQNHQSEREEEEIEEIIMAPKDELKADMEFVESSLDSIVSTLEDHEDEPIDEATILVYIEELKHIQSSIRGIGAKIFRIYTTEEDEKLERLQSYEAMNKKSMEASSKANRIKMSHVSYRERNSQNKVKLQPISLPTFNGDYGDWPLFEDKFDSLVHQSTSMSDVEKLERLINCLGPQARIVIKNMKTTDENYEAVYDTLKETFKHERKATFSYLTTLFELPIIEKQDGAQLSHMVNIVKATVRALETRHRPGPDQEDLFADIIIVFMVLNRLDSTTRRDFENSLPNDKVPKLEELLQFITRRAHALSEVPIGQESHNNNQNKSNHSNQKVNNQNPHSNNRNNRQSSQSPVPSTSSSTLKCSFCPMSHPAYKCQVFRGWPVAERYTAVKKAQLCVNCLFSSHQVSTCPVKSDPSHCCKKCGKPHHTLIHDDSWVSRKSPATSQRPSSSPSTAAATHNVKAETQGMNSLLATAEIIIQNEKGETQRVRALIDNGSQVSLITTKCANLLKLHRERQSNSITGTGEIPIGTSTASTTFTIKSRFSSFSITVEALILESVTGILPTNKFDTTNWHHIEDKILADEKFNIPGKIDIILGVIPFTQIMRDEIITGPPGTPKAYRTHLGYILMGENSTSPAASFKVHHTFAEMDDLGKFFNTEDIPIKKELSPEEIQCEEIFEKTTRRTETGRFVTDLPFKKTDEESGQELSESLPMAFCRLHHLERRFTSDPNLRHEYNKFMQEYLDLKHMELIPPHQVSISPSKSYYIPHHGIIKPSSTTTKFRVVFDASAKTRNGPSLNEILLVGPTVQDDLMSILLRFRIYRYAYTADIAKMYRQILISSHQQDYQRILWRFSENDPIQHYRLLTLTYGTGPAPFIATRSLKKLAQDESHKFPLAASVLENDFYMDDLMSGVHSIPGGLDTQHQLLSILQGGCFAIRKWSSNCSKLLERIPIEDRETDLPLKIGETDSIKALGIFWNPASDGFFFKYEVTPTGKITKRSISSQIGKLFDPPGWLAPVIIVAKILLQEVWKQKIEWDEEVSDSLKIQWTQYLINLPVINEIQIPRYVRYRPSDSKWELHGFCDASIKAYAACVYLRGIYSDGKIVSHLIMSKTKVAPINFSSVPRLELCGAVRLVETMMFVVNALKIQIDKKYFWTDATTVLHWIKSTSPHTIKDQYVGRRVIKILSDSKSQEWNHIRTEENPADAASRGISPQDLKSHPLWWSGPPWILKEPIIIPEFPPSSTILQSEENQSSSISHHSKSSQSILSHLLKYSNWFRMKSVAARILIFVKALKKELTPQKDLTPDHILMGERVIIQALQSQEFPDEIKACHQKKPISQKSSLIQLAPKMDEDGILRVSGRLEESNLPPSRKEPIILPRNHVITRRIIEYYHRTLLHAGPQTTLSHITGRYWILHGRDTINHVLRKCMKCLRLRSIQSTQIMAPLPAPRVNPSRPFTNTGVDCAGPFNLKLRHGRSKNSFKGYIVLFTCFATRAIHLELLTDMTTNCFLNALKRFIGRRGVPANMYSDCGTNFIGARNELKVLHQQVMSVEEDPFIKNQLAQQQINWHFNSPASPHHGGVWEIGVKLVKSHLKKILTAEIMTEDEFYTLLIQVEAIVNSRPLTVLSANSDDLRPLTPGHFLIGDELIAPPEPDIRHLKMNRLSRFQLITRLRQEFWNRWANEYLNLLQVRRKWTSETTDFKVGDLFILKEDNIPPMQWKIGRILQVFPGSDGHVRVVEIQMGNKKVYRRPITKLCPLPFDSPE